MPNIDMTLTFGNVVQLFGYIIVAIGLYFGIRMDLAIMRAKAESTQAKSVEAYDHAADAHTKIYEHVQDLHTNGNRRN